MEGEVEQFSLKGYGIVKDVELAHTVPGDQILFELTRKKRSPKKGRVLEILSPSKSRVEPFCRHAGICGGCCWQQMSYSAQLREKQARVEKALGCKTLPIIGSFLLQGYRNKMEFSFSENRAGTRFLGLMIAQAEPYVFNVEECHLGPPWFAKTLSEIRNWWESTSLNAYNPPKDTGSLRYVTFRFGHYTGEKMVILNVSGNPEYALKEEEKKGFVEAVCKSIEDEVSVFLRVHKTKKGTPTEFFEEHLSGRTHIFETLPLKSGPLTFMISPSSFFQPSSTAATLLYDTALGLAKPEGIVYDLYSGTGSLGMVFARRAKKVIAIEMSPEAVKDARSNAERNHIDNIEIHQGDVGKILGQIPRNISPDLVIVDPPRAGLSPTALSHIKALKAKNILYISCNPITLAQNAQDLMSAGYKIDCLQPIDQFPHTYHIENITLFSAL